MSGAVPAGRAVAGALVPPDQGARPVSSRRAGGERTSPALGITWSSQLLMRLLMDRRRPEEAAPAPPSRTLRLVFAPHLPPWSCCYTVTTEGVRGTPGSESCWMTRQVRVSGRTGLPT